MCGILAVLDFDSDPICRETFIRMRDSMYHRGPDDAGIYLDRSVALGHRRLSIIDLSMTGHQPMSNEDGSIWIIFNGEVYNYIELRQELTRKGHRFLSSSDTEVIIHQYEEDGVDCLHKFNGMFAFVIWDATTQELFAARDRVGIKPLYYYADGKRVILASEIKGIIEDPRVPREPDYQGIADYFFAGRTLSDKTMFSNIKELQPGHLLLMKKRKKQMNIRKYWDVKYQYNYSRTNYAVIDELFHLLDDAVKVHTRSDAALGCHLSGGIDTSTVVAFAARHRRELKTFTIKFSDDEYIDETRYAKAVAKQAGVQYHERTPAALDIAELLPLLIWHSDIPMANEGGFSYYTASRFASEFVKVSLTGHGGDEIFAGYPAQFQAAFGNTDMFELHWDPVRMAQTSSFQRLLRHLLHGSYRSIYNSVRNRLIKGNVTFDQLWISLHCGYLPTNDHVFQGSFAKLLQGYSPREEYIKPIIEVDTEYILDKCLYHDLRVYLPSLLHQEDRASMAVSIESRVPLLDHRIIEFLASVPPEQKVKDLVPKYLERKVSSSLVPEEVVTRKDKRPFPIPGRFWLQKEVQEMVRELLLSPDSLTGGIIEPDVVKAACSHVSSSDLMWPLVNLELWFKIFIDKDRSWIDRVNSMKAASHSYG